MSGIERQVNESFTSENKQIHNSGKTDHQTRRNHKGPALVSANIQQLGGKEKPGEDTEEGQWGRRRKLNTKSGHWSS